MFERHGLCAFLCAALSFVSAAQATDRSAPDKTVLSSKVFTESVILGEIGVQLLQSSNLPAQHRRELGGTRILWSALLRGDIACYPEYTGTLRTEIFSAQKIDSDEQLTSALTQSKVWRSKSLGFNNTYVLGMPRALATRLGITKISQLAQHPELRIGFSNEFIQRADGWPGLRQQYQLPQTDVRGLAHDLAYQAIAAKSIDLTDLYSTDAEIVRYDLVALADDRHFFPDYDAIFVCRSDVPEKVRARLDELAGRIDAKTMAAMNARAKLDHVPESVVAADYLKRNFQLATHVQQESRASRVWQRTREHLAMVGVSLFAACVVAIPLGIFAFYRRRAGQIVFAIADILQTLPALALLVFLIPWLGIGYAPAIVALFLYSVLPILRNTYTGLAEIPTDQRESAQALGLSTAFRLRAIELPLASRSIIAGIRTAAVINVGTATLGALIGAGGYGQPILTGIRLDNLSMILEGAVPSAVLALAVQALFTWLEHYWVRQK
jgi:osmoprotectant transport system permease protein